MSNMKNMRETRRSKKMTQDRLSKLSGIYPSNISAIEHGRYKPNKRTRERIEHVLGPIDWVETEGITLQESSYFRAERLLKEIVEITFTMNNKQKEEFTQLVNKYFK
jgi:transcriptional regulator with XRE-family HTH domain